MASVPSAAYDPIFYLHHANIDRLWADWQAALVDKAGSGEQPMTPVLERVGQIRLPARTQPRLVVEKELAIQRQQPGADGADGIRVGMRGRGAAPPERRCRELRRWAHPRCDEVRDGGIVTADLAGARREKKTHRVED